MKPENSTQVITVKLRVSADLKQKIVKSSEKYNRSMNADIVARLEESFKHDFTDQNMLQEFDAVVRQQEFKNTITALLVAVAAEGISLETIDKIVNKSYEIEDHLRASIDQVNQNRKNLESTDAG